MILNNTYSRMLTQSARILAVMLCAVILVLPSMAGALDKATQGLLFPYYGKNKPICGDSSGDETGGASAVITGNNVKDAFAFFVAKGFTPVQAAGILGNLMWESGVNPKSEQKQGGNAKGIAQWEGGRFTNLVNFAAKRDKKWNDSLQLQLDFLWHELQTSEKTAYKDIKSQTTVDGATISFLTKFERAGIPHADKRKELAKQAYARYGGTGTLPAPTTPAPAADACPDSGDADEGVDTDPNDIFGNSASMKCTVGRDGGVQDGYRDGKKRRVRICVVGGIEVNAKIEKNVAALLKARSMGGGGFRSMSEQIRLRRKNGCRDVYTTPSSQCRVPTARPGYSNHQMGLAIDFDLQGGDFAWLKKNAAKYGLKNFPAENWHWSVDGT